MAIKKKTQTSDNKYYPVGYQGCGEQETLVQWWWEYKLVQPLYKAAWRFLTKLKIELHYDPATLLLGIDPEKTLI